MARKILGNQKGLTFLEIVVSIAILAILIVPALGIFVQSLKINAYAGQVVKNTFSVIQSLEKQNDLNYEQLYNLINDNEYRDTQLGENSKYIYKFNVKPDGMRVPGMNNARYLQIIMYADYAYCLAPDGRMYKWIFNPGTDNLNINITVNTDDRPDTDVNMLGNNISVQSAGPLILVLHAEGKTPERVVSVSFYGMGDKYVQCFSRNQKDDTIKYFNIEDRLFVKYIIYKPKLLVNITISARYGQSDVTMDDSVYADTSQAVDSVMTMPA